MRVEEQAVTCKVLPSSRAHYLALTSITFSDVFYFTILFLESVHQYYLIDRGRQSMDLRFNANSKQFFKSLLKL